MLKFPLHLELEKILEKKEGFFFVAKEKELGEIKCDSLSKLLLNKKEMYYVYALLSDPSLQDYKSFSEISSLLSEENEEEEVLKFQLWLCCHFLCSFERTFSKKFDSKQDKIDKLFSQWSRCKMKMLGLLLSLQTKADEKLDFFSSQQAHQLVLMVVDNLLRQPWTFAVGRICLILHIFFYTFLFKLKR